MCRALWEIWMCPGVLRGWYACDHSNLDMSESAESQAQAGTQVCWYSDQLPCGGQKVMMPVGTLALNGHEWQPAKGHVSQLWVASLNLMVVSTPKIHRTSQNDLCLNVHLPMGDTEVDIVPWCPMPVSSGSANSGRRQFDSLPGWSKIDSKWSASRIIQGKSPLTPQIHCPKKWAKLKTANWC